MPKENFFIYPMLPTRYSRIQRMKIRKKVNEILSQGNMSVLARSSLPRSTDNEPKEMSILARSSLPRSTDNKPKEMSILARSSLPRSCEQKSDESNNTLTEKNNKVKTYKRD